MCGQVQTVVTLTITLAIQLFLQERNNWQTHLLSISGYRIIAEIETDMQIPEDTS